MIQLAPLLATLGRSQEYLARVEGLPPSPWLEAGIAAASGNWSRSGEVLEEIGAVTDAAAVRLRAAHTLLTAGRRAEGEEHLHRALEFYRSVGATAYVRDGESLLAATA